MVEMSRMLHRFAKRSDINRDQESRKSFLSACLIVKDEARYILVWIAYQRTVGFEFFYIYDNDSSDGLKALLAPLKRKGICLVVDWPRSAYPESPQGHAYYHCFKTYGEGTEWLATIDADEFVVPRTSDSVASILKNHFFARDTVLCNWRVFGSAGHRNESDQLCIENFHRAGEWNFSGNNNVKSIFRSKN